MLYIAACGNEASVRKYLKEMEGEYVREDVQILCGDEIEGSGTKPDVLFLSDSGIEECQKKIPVWFRRKAFDNAGELKQRKAGAERKRPLLIKTDGTYCCVDQKTILYAESVGRKVVLHTNTGNHCILCQNEGGGRNFRQRVFPLPSRVSGEFCRGKKF